jgi:hypothetical protein
LKNELNFERYLKQQHLSYIGKLRRKHVLQARAEAETQNLINSNKALKNKVEQLESEKAQVRKDFETRRAQSKMWDADMIKKLKVLREEKKKWDAETERIRRDLKTANESNEQLKQLVVTREAEELTWRYKLQSIGTNIGEAERLRTEVDKLTANIRTYEGREVEIELAHEQEALATTRAEILEMKLKAVQNELEKTRVASHNEIETLRALLEEAKQDLKSRQPKGFQAMLDDALAVSRSRLAEVEKAHDHLLSRFTALQQQLLSLQDQDPDEPLLAGGGIHYHFDTAPNYTMGSSPEGPRMRRRGLSDPDSIDRSGYSFSPPDDQSTSYSPIKPARANTSTTVSSARPSSQNEIRSPSRLASSGLPRHTRSGSADSAQAGRSLDVEGLTKQKIKPASDIRVYGRGLYSRDCR